MKLLELFAAIDEIAPTKLSKSQSWKVFKKGPRWAGWHMLPKPFMKYEVLYGPVGSTIKWFAIVDPTKFQEPDPNGAKHAMQGVDLDIPNEAIVGGFNLVRAGGPAGISWKVQYMALNPEYQGQGIPWRFYIWMLENYPITKIGAIKAGDSQTPGSQKFWATLSKKLLVFAYDPSTKQKSPVEIGADGNLEAKFDIYPEKDAQIRKDYAAELKMLNDQLRSKDIDEKTYKKRKTEIEHQRDQELTSSDRAVDAELYAILPTGKKLPK